jgi:hypothetical protein
MVELYINKSKIAGKGLHVKTKVKKGQRVGYVHGPIVVFRKFNPQISKKMINWIGVGRFSWIDTSNSPFRYINHSCDPNVAIVGKRTVIAIKNIEANDEITMDYSLTEAEPGWQITCDCKSSECRKIITPISKLPKKVFNKHIEHIPENFKRIYYIDNK